MAEDTIIYIYIDIDVDIITYSDIVWKNRFLVVSEYEHDELNFTT